MSLIILAKSGEGRQGEESEGAVGRRREMGCRSEMDLRFGGEGGRLDRWCGVLMWEISMIWETKATLQYHYKIQIDLLWQ